MAEQRAILARGAVVQKPVLVRYTERLNVGIEHLVPEAFVFAIILTAIVFGMGIVLESKSAFEMLRFWAEGFWGFLAFAMQMALIVITGHTLATSPLGRRLVNWLARIPKSSRAAVAFIVPVTAATAFFSWGLGLIVGGLLAVAIARRLRRVDFKLLVAAAYTGMMIGTNGLSVTEPLMVNTPGHFLEDKIGLIPLTETVLSAQMLVPIAVSAVVIAALAWFMHTPNESDLPEVALAEEPQPAPADDAARRTLAGRLDHSTILSWLISVPGLIYCVWWFATRGFDLNLNIFIFLLLMLGLLLHGSPIAYVNAIQNAVGATAGIILQFPFYAGIQGMMASSGLVVTIAGWFTSVASAFLFPAITFISSFVLNFFIPSSGGIWMVQGPVMIEAATNLGVSAATTVNAFTAGEVVGNIIQPFWAIPMLGLAGLRMKDVMGYCIVFSVVISIIFIVALTLL